MANLIIPGEAKQLEVASIPSPVVSSVPDASLPLEISDSAAKAGCYEFLYEEFFVDSTNPDPALVAQIRREADPRYVPLRCRRIYRSPSGAEVVRTYHVIGKYIPYPEDSYSDAYVHLVSYPSNFPFPPDRIQPLRTLWAPWEKGSVEDNNNTPPAEVRFAGWVVEQMRALRKTYDTAVRIDTKADGSVAVTNDDFVKDKVREILDAESKRDEAEMKAARDEARYRMRHNWAQIKRAADEERWAPEPQASAAFCDLGRR